MVTHRATCPPIAPPAGVRMISLSYSRISLADIAQKLQLDSPEDAEFIVAKVGCALPASYTGAGVEGNSPEGMAITSLKCQ